MGSRTGRWGRGGVGGRLVVLTEFTGNIQMETQERITDSFLGSTRGSLQTYFIYCLLNWEICSNSSTHGGLACGARVILTRSWHNLVECDIILCRTCEFLSLNATDIFLHLLCICLQANEYSLPSLNTGLEDVKPSLSTSASSDLASSVSQSYSVVTGTIWLTLDWSLKEYTQLQQVEDICSTVVELNAENRSSVCSALLLLPRLSNCSPKVFYLK